MSTKPVVEIPDEPLLDQLVVTDLVLGHGTEAAAGDRCRVHYVGVAWSTRAEFDSSWEGAPFEFELGRASVIAGWDEGLLGMRVGGRRRLVVPPRLAYGDEGAGLFVRPSETLVFVVDLLDVQHGAPGGTWKDRLRTVLRERAPE